MSPTGAIDRGSTLQRRFSGRQGMRLKRITMAEYYAKAVRPLNFCLSKTSLDAVGFQDC